MIIRPVANYTVNPSEDTQGEERDRKKQALNRRGPDKKKPSQPAVLATVSDPGDGSQALAQPVESVKIVELLPKEMEKQPHAAEKYSKTVKALTEKTTSHRKVGRAF